MVERVHSKFIKRLPLSSHSRFSFSLMKHSRFHAAVQIFKSIQKQSLPYLHDIFIVPKTLLVVLVGISTDFLFQELTITLKTEVFIVELSCVILYHRL